MLALVHPHQPTAPSSSSSSTTTTIAPSAVSSRQLSLRKAPSSSFAASLSSPFLSSSSLAVPKRPPTTSAAVATTPATSTVPQLQHRHTAPPQLTSTNPPTTSPAQPAPSPPRLSLDIHTYPSTDLLRLLASLLTQIASTNDKLSPPTSPSALSPNQPRPPIWNTLTAASRTALSTPSSPLAFHARNVPSISLESYLLRILKYCPATNDVFLALLVYFDRMAKLSLEARGRAFVIDSYNVHRLVIAGVTVSSKFFSDVFYTNSRYAKVGGLPLAELNQLELQFLLLNNFNLVISPDEMQRYAEQLILFSESNAGNSSTTDSLSSNQANVPSPPRGMLDHPHHPPLHQTTSSLQSQNHHAPTYSPHPQRLQPSSDSVTVTTTPESQAAMGAIDAYGGSVPGSRPSPSFFEIQPPPNYSSASQNHASQNGIPAGAGTPRPIITRRRRRRQNNSSSPSASDDGKDGEYDDGDYDYDYDDPSGYTTEDTIETETDAGETTDDETTIRPTRSRDSLCSTSTTSTSASEVNRGDRARRDYDGDFGMGSP